MGTVLLLGPSACGGPAVGTASGTPSPDHTTTSIVTHPAFVPSFTVVGTPGPLSLGKDGFYHGSVTLEISNMGSAAGVAEWVVLAGERSGDDGFYATIERVQTSRALFSIGRYPGHGPKTDFSLSYRAHDTNRIDVGYRLPADFIRQATSQGGVQIRLSPNDTPGANTVADWPVNAPYWYPTVNGPYWYPSISAVVQGRTTQVPSLR